MYGFQKFETIRSFGDSIYTGKFSIDEAEMDQTNLWYGKIYKKSKPKLKEGKEKKRNTLDSVNFLYEGHELTLNVFRIGMFPIKETQGKGSPRMLDWCTSDSVRVARIACVAKSSNCKLFHRTRLKILTPKQML